MRPTRPYTYLSTVQAMCRECREIVPARIVESDGHVFQKSLCPTCARQRVRVADSIEWYNHRMASATIARPWRAETNPVVGSCPRDCGPCGGHAVACHLPVFSITNVCDMRCPICFTYNRPDQRYFMSRAEMRSLLDRLLARTGDLDLVNITGGEPTCHPGLGELLAEARRPEIGRVTVNSNGLRIARDEELCRQLADAGAYVILSMHTLRPERSMAIHGRDVVSEKLRALENLQRHGIGTTLLNCMIRGVNDDEIGEIVHLARIHPVVRSITVQTMTYTGQGGGQFSLGEHMPLDGAENALEAATRGQMRPKHFFPHPNAHPLCYSIAYYLRTGPGLTSFTDLLPAGSLRASFDGYLMHLTDGAAEELRGRIDSLYAEGAEAALLKALRQLVLTTQRPGSRLTRHEQQKLAETEILTVYIHSHMDEDTLDVGRLSQCPDQVPDPDGRLIPACSYNLFYRQRDPRFYAQGVDACRSR